MYESFYKLDCKPFALTPDPEFLFLSRQHGSALATLRYAILGGAGITVVTGEVGSGKSTLLRELLRSIRTSCTVGLITNTHPNFSDVLPWVLRAFGQKIQPGEDTVGAYDRLITFVNKEFMNNRQVVLVIDEAQNLDLAALEELRLLSNLNIGRDMQLQLILVGQTELSEKLVQPSMRAFAQRIAAEFEIPPLNYKQANEYISHRLAVAGGSPSIFSNIARAAIYYHSHGVPRLINTICDLALVFGFGEAQRIIGIDIVREVVLGKIISLSHLQKLERSAEADQLREELLGRVDVDIAFEKELQRIPETDNVVEPLTDWNLEN